MPTNLTDPASGAKYFQAATTLSKAAAAGMGVSQIQSLPFFENIFPGWLLSLEQTPALNVVAYLEGKLKFPVANVSQGDHRRGQNMSDRSDLSSPCDAGS